MNKRIVLTTTAAVLMSTAAFAQNGTKEAPAAPSAHQDRSDQRSNSASPQARSPSAAPDTRSPQAARSAPATNGDGVSSERGSMDRTNADRANTEKTSKSTTSEGTPDRAKEGTAARDDARPNSERAQTKEPASDGRQSNNPDGARPLAPVDREGCRGARSTRCPVSRGERTA